MKPVKYIVLLLIALMATPKVAAVTVPAISDTTEAWQRQVRRLHPERERAKAMKKLQEERSRRADEKADPWDTSEEVWGTVDAPPAAMRDSTAVVGHRLQQAGQKEGVRLTWRDDPVTVTREQLMTVMALEDGEWRSRYVTGDSVGNEVYFSFLVDEDSVPGPLRLSVRYCGDSPLDFDQVVFTIDGYNYSFYPAEPRQGRQDDGVWWAASDDDLQEAYRDLVYALAHGNWVMMKLQGMSGVNRTKVLTDGQRSDFAATLALFLLMGGSVGD